MIPIGIVFIVAFVLVIFMLMKHAAKRELAYEMELTRKADARFRTRYLNAAFGPED